jgi:hypothetical protein
MYTYANTGKHSCAHTHIHALSLDPGIKLADSRNEEIFRVLGNSISHM